MVLAQHDLSAAIRLAESNVALAGAWEVTQHVATLLILADLRAAAQQWAQALDALAEADAVVESVQSASADDPLLDMLRQETLVLTATVRALNGDAETASAAAAELSLAHGGDRNAQFDVALAVLRASLAANAGDAQAAALAWDEAEQIRGERASPWTPLALYVRQLTRPSPRDQG
jgi:hypothetical protein